MEKKAYNTNNSNSEYQDFMECDFRKHWSFSNFNRHLITASAINDFYEENKLPLNIVELGAGDSNLSSMLYYNFNKIAAVSVYYKFDVDEKYSSHCEIRDITTREFEKELKKIKPNVIILEEVIEHISKTDGKELIRTCYESMKNNGLLIVSTPTPPYTGIFENLVWPDDHEEEYKEYEIYQLLNKYFKIEKRIGWSMEKRDFNEILEFDDFARRVYCKLRGAFPESYIRALLPSLLEEKHSRQMLYICRKRRGIVNA